MTKKWVAVCLPAGQEKVFLCKTRKEAEQCIIDHCCKECQKEGMQSPCALEWLIMPEEKYNKATTMSDLWEAAGYKIEYRRPVNGY